MEIKITFDGYLCGYDPFNLNDVLLTSSGEKYKIIKFYSNTWWRRFLVKFGFENNIGYYKLVRVL